MAAKAAFELARLKTPAIIAGVAILAVVVIVLLIVLWKGLRDLLDGTSETLGNVGGIAADLTGGIRSVTETGASLIELPALAATKRDDLSFEGDTPDDFSISKPDLSLSVISKEDGSTSTRLFGLVGKKGKTNKVTLKVTSGGQPVGGALIQQRFPHFTTNKMLGTRTEVTRSDGTATFYWEVPNLPGESEDDAIFAATKKGFNPSNKIHVK